MVEHSFEWYIDLLKGILISSYFISFNQIYNFYELNLNFWAQPGPKTILVGESSKEIINDLTLSVNLAKGSSIISFPKWLFRMGSPAALTVLATVSPRVLVMGHVCIPINTEILESLECK